MQVLSGMHTFQVKSFGQEIEDEVTYIFGLSLPLELYFSPFRLCILSSSHTEVREATQIDHIFSLPFSILSPLGMTFLTLLIYLTSNSSFNVSFCFTSFSYQYYLGAHFCVPSIICAPVP